jgi:hypothetical protein
MHSKWIWIGAPLWPKKHSSSTVLMFDNHPPTTPPQDTLLKMAQMRWLTDKLKCYICITKQDLHPLPIRLGSSQATGLFSSNIFGTDIYGMSIFMKCENLVLKFGFHFGFVLFGFVSFRSVSFRFDWFRFDWFGFVSFRFRFALYRHPLGWG